MWWFESKEDKEARKRQEERNRIYQEEQEVAERSRREKEEDAKERAEYIAELKDELACENSDIITIHLADDTNAWRKQIALNFMLKHGYICVQNDVYCDRFYHYYDLTFVKKEHADFFKV